MMAKGSTRITVCFARQDLSGSTGATSVQPPGRRKQRVIFDDQRAFVSSSSGDALDCPLPVGVDEMRAVSAENLRDRVPTSAPVNVDIHDLVPLGIRLGIEVYSSTVSVASRARVTPPLCTPSASICRASPDSNQVPVSVPARSGVDSGVCRGSS
jgi:hypothetical protein